MQEMLEFLEQNYLWIIIGGIIILMAIIGYIADKKDFIGKKQEERKNDKKIKEKKTKEKKEPLKVELKGIGDITEKLREEPVNIDEKLKNEPTIDLSREDLFTPLESKEEESEEIDQSLFEPITSNNEETAPDYEPVDQALFAPLEPTESVATNFDEVLEQPEELPAIEPVSLDNLDMNSKEEQSSDDDIWKF